MTDIPTSVKIGWRTYRIVAMDIRKSGAVDYWGEADHQMHEIRLSSSGGSRLMASTFLHEILHGIFKQWSLPASNEDEEPTVQTIQHGLCCVWRDNPDVMAWIGKYLVEGDD